MKVISGEYKGKKGVIQARTPTHYYDVHLKHKDSVFEQEIPKGWNSMIVCYEGSLVVNDKSVDAILAIAFKRNLENSETIHIEAGPNGAKFIMICGQPIEEPVAWKGPFVMNTEAEIHQAFVYPVTLGAPAILHDEHVTVIPPPLVVEPQAI